MTGDLKRKYFVYDIKSFPILGYRESSSTTFKKKKQKTKKQTKPKRQLFCITF